jgi:hypothetical protein
MTKPPPGAGRRAGEADNFEECSALHSLDLRRLQACPSDCLARLRLYRLDLTTWDSTGRRGAMPQPGEYGLRLPPLDPEAVLW